MARKPPAKPTPETDLATVLEAMLQQQFRYLVGKVDTTDLAREIIASSPTPADAIDALVGIGTRSGASGGSAIDTLRRHGLKLRINGFLAPRRG
jgi:hypothetical protein